jgi:two-component system chemotaxis response regulator CheY
MARILVVDDAPFIRELIRAMLEARGHEIVAEAIDGDMAVELALKLRPDIILMDLIMPKKSGVEASREIISAWPDANIIAVSTADHESLLVKAVEAGCRRFVAKPFQKDEIIDVIEGGLVAI